MFATTLRINPDLGAFLQEMARLEDLRVNAFLTKLIEREREARRRRRLEADWVAFAGEGLDASFALAAQAEIAAEPPVPYRAAAPKPRTGRRGA